CDVDVLLDVPDRAHHAHARAHDAVGPRAGSLDLVDDRLDLRLGGGLLHHDHHRLILSLTPGSCGSPGWAGRERGRIAPRGWRSVLVEDPGAAACTRSRPGASRSA